MVLFSPFTISLSANDEALLSARAVSARAPFRDVLRARIVLAAARGEPNAVTAAGLGIHVDTVRKWRKRYAAAGLDGLKDLPRAGRPVTFTPVQVAGIKALACTPPADKDVPLSRWSSAELAAQAVTEELVGSISPATVARWLAADEKSQLQALRRRHPGLGTGPGRTRRIEFEYRRGGTLAYFAAYDVHHPKVIGTIAEKTGIKPFTELVEKVMTTEPYASAKRVFSVVDNGSSHNGARSIERMNADWPTATLIHLPVHASWLNQVEIHFSILQRKAITGAVSKTSISSRSACSPSSTATTARQKPSTGNTPAPTSTTTCAAWANTNRRWPPDPRRTNENAH